MTQIFLVIAYGGQYEDAWERVLRACYSEESAQTTIDNLVKYLDEIRGTEFPESLEEWNFDFEDDDDVCRHDISETEVVHMALSRLAKDELPAYEADDGPLSAADMKALNKVAAAALPKGRVIKKQSLF